MTELATFTFNVFEIFEDISSMFPESMLLEISVRQSQISLIFEQEILLVSSLNAELFNSVTDDALLMCVEDKLNLVLPFRKSGVNISISNDSFINLRFLIQKISDTICKCPALEIVFSNQYLKCYLDKPGLTVDDLQQYQKLFDAEGTLELHTQRPYLLFINENLTMEDFND